MTVVVAHQVSPTSRAALVQGIKEATFRDTDLVVLHVVESLDADRREAYRLGVADEIEKIVGQDPGVSWELRLSTAGADLGDALLAQVGKIDADLLVIGARRRSPVGKAILGSVAQTLILEANLPVLVVKTP
jgi:nucleotide-binding universal stress UspA family protein